MSNPYDKNFFAREFENLTLDFRLWLQRRRDRKAIGRAIEEIEKTRLDPSELIETEDEPALRMFRTPPEPARAVAKWKSPGTRRFRIGMWRTFRPWLRWQRRHAFLAALIVWGPLLAVGGTLTWHYLEPLLQPAEDSSAVAMAAAEFTDSNALFEDAEEESGLMTMTGVPAARLSILGDLPGDESPRQLLAKADALFIQRDFPAAAEAYQQLLPFHPRKPVVIFRIFLCKAGAGRIDEARQMLEMMPLPPLGQSPAGFFARGVLEQLAGNPVTAEQLVSEGRALFPLVIEAYDDALRESGLMLPQAAQAAP